MSASLSQYLSQQPMVSCSYDKLMSSEDACCRVFEKHCDNGTRSMLCCCCRLETSNAATADLRSNCNRINVLHCSHACCANSRLTFSNNSGVAMTCSTSDVEHCKAPSVAQCRHGQHGASCFCRQWCHSDSLIDTVSCWQRQHLLRLQSQKLQVN